MSTAELDQQKVAPAAQLGAVKAISRGVKTAPEFAVGIGRTIAYAMLGAVGRVTVPILIQQAIDRGFKKDRIDVGLIGMIALVGVVVVLITSVAQRAAVGRLGAMAGAERQEGDEQVHASRHRQLSAPRG